MKIKIKLFYKFVFWMLILAVVPLGVVGMMLIRVNESALQGAILELHTNIAESLRDKIDDYMTDLKAKLSFVITSQRGLQMSWLEKQVILQSLLEASSDFVAISIADKEGFELIKVVNEELVKEPKLVNRAKDKSFKSAIKGNPEISRVYFVKNRPRINVVYPFDEGQVIFIEIALQNLWKKIYNVSLGATGFAFLVDNEGKIIAHREIEKAINAADVSNLEIVQAVLSGNTIGSKEYIDDNEVGMVGAYAPLQKMDWGIIVQQEKDDAYWSVKEMKTKARTAILITSICAALIGFFTARNLSRPVLKLIKGARRVADGDFEGVVKVRTRDELLTLADTFNLMTRKLKEYNDVQIDRLIEERTKTTAVIYSISDGLVMTDFSGKIMLLNKSARSMLGIKEMNIEDNYIFDYIRDGRISEGLKEIFEKKDETVIKELDFSSETVKRIIRSTTDAVITDKGKDLGIVTVLHDITLEKEIEQMKEDFISSITHDLRSPMTSIRGFLEIILSGSVGELNEQQKEFLDIIDDSSKRLLGLINNILDVAKLESGKMDVILGKTDFKKLVGKIIKGMHPLALKGRVSLISKGFEKIPVIKADLNLMERVIINLVGNALKFTPPEGRVTVEGKEFKDKIQISVIDTGEGIPADFVGKVFDKFQQVIKGKRKKKGTGLGLTICKYIVESHKGEIRVESQVGKGSTFLFQIPKHLYTEKGEVIIGKPAEHES